MIIQLIKNYQGLIRNEILYRVQLMEPSQKGAGWRSNFMLPKDSVVKSLD